MARPKRSPEVAARFGANLGTGLVHIEPVSDVTQYPFSAVGKLYFRQDGVLYFGTAGVVAERGVFTAAHNLWDHGAASTDVEFLLEYERGSARGRFLPDPGQIHIPPEWKKPDATASTNFATFRTTQAMPVGEVGVLTFHRSGQSLNGHDALAIGYPTGGGLDGEVMYQCVGTIDYCTIILNQMEGDLGDGAGGGPWLTDIGGALQMIGATALTYEAAGVMTSPPFTDWLESYINKVSG